MELEYKSVSELGEIITGKTPSTEKKEYWDGGSIPFITPTDIMGYDMRYIYATERYVTDVGANTQKKTVLPPNTICVSCIASIGKMCITSAERSITNQQINSLLVRERYDFRYVFYLLRYFLPYIQLIAGGTGAGTPIISKSKFSKLKYPICKELRQQTKIASILFAYDSLIELNNKRIKVLEQMAENLYKEWFVRFRFPGHETAEFVDGLPKGWEVRKIREIVQRLRFGKLYKAEDTEQDGKVIVLDQSQEQYVGFHNDEPSHIASPETPIVIFGDHSCKHQLIIRPFSLSENVVPFVGKNGVLTTYLYYLTHGVIETKEYKRHWSELMAKKVLVAPLKLQKQFVDLVLPILVLILKVTDQNRYLARQRDLLLPRLMSGKLEV